MGIATRILALRRPDFFFSINTPNKIKFYQEWKIISNEINNLDDYWEIVLKKIHRSPWWQLTSPKNESPENIEIWRGRAALLDSIYCPGGEI
jgi:hypothetical protein